MFAEVEENVIDTRGKSTHIPYELIFLVIVVNVTNVEGHILCESWAKFFPWVAFSGSCLTTFKIEVFFEWQSY